MKSHLDMLVVLADELRQIGGRIVDHTYSDDDESAWRLQIAVGRTRVSFSYTGFREQDFLVSRSAEWSARKLDWVSDTGVVDRRRWRKGFLRPILAICEEISEQELSSTIKKRKK